MNKQKYDCPNCHIISDVEVKHQESEERGEFGDMRKLQFLVLACPMCGTVHSVRDHRENVEQKKTS